MKAMLIVPDGREMEVEVSEGESLMRASVSRGLPGIVGECGGAPTCGTCHVFVDDEFLPRLPEMTDNEDQILDYTAAERKPNSRLACQIKMTPELDGIRVTVADPEI